VTEPYSIPCAGAEDLRGVGAGGRRAVGWAVEKLPFSCRAEQQAPPPLGSLVVSGREDEMELPPLCQSQSLSLLSNRIGPLFYLLHASKRKVCTFGSQTKPRSSKFEFSFCRRTPSSFLFVFILFFNLSPASWLCFF
jgi:hypothetical protein